MTKVLIFCYIVLILMASAIAGRLAETRVDKCKKECGIYKLEDAKEDFCVCNLKELAVETE